MKAIDDIQGKLKQTKKIYKEKKHQKKLDREKAEKERLDNELKKLQEEKDKIEAEKKHLLEMSDKELMVEAIMAIRGFYQRFSELETSHADICERMQEVESDIAYLYASVEALERSDDD